MHQTKNAQPRVRLSARNLDQLAGVISSEFTPDPLALQAQRILRRLNVSQAVARTLAEHAFATTRESGR